MTSAKVVKMDQKAKLGHYVVFLEKMLNSNCPWSLQARGIYNLGAE